MPRLSYCVYEVVNPMLREVIVGISDTPSLQEIQKRHEKLPPVWMARWRPEHKPVYKMIEADLSQEEASTFAKRYSAAGVWASFKVYVTN